MTTESPTQDQAATTTEGNAASDALDSVQATADALYGDKQQAEGKQDQQAQDSATTDKADGDTEGNQADDTEAKGAPEKYEFKPPQGREFDTEVLNNFSEVAKELNLTQDAAQKLLDKMGPIVEQRQIQQIEQVRSQWADASRNDKEFGGEKLPENLAVAKKALDQFGTPELRTLLNESGLGNHPDVIRFMYRAGKAISEDRYVGGDIGKGSKSQPKGFNDLASALYESQT
jgi:hypothetical protein